MDCREASREVRDPLADDCPLWRGTMDGLECSGSSEEGKWTDTN